MRIQVSRNALQGEVYTLLEEIRFGELTVPAGFRSDGASVPRFFWRVVFPPGDPKALRAAFLHDYIYATHPEGWSREEADELFLGVMVLDGVPSLRAYLAYLGVRLFGWKAWKEAADEHP